MPRTSGRGGLAYLAALCGVLGCRDPLLGKLCALAWGDQPQSLPTHRARNLVCNYFLGAKPHFTQNVPCVLAKTWGRFAGGGKPTIEPDGTGNGFQSPELRT